MLRRFAVAVTLAALVAGCARGASTPPEPGPKPPAPPPVQEAAAYDLVIRGATIVDGTGSAGYTGDVAITGERIAAVGKLGPYKANREIDAKGMVVAPGFINPHSHTHDFINPYRDWDTTASLMQGITTEIGGVDGRSPMTIGQQLGGVAAQGTGVNFGVFAGQGSIRERVMGNWRGPASADQLEAMKKLVRQSMAEGAFGLSSGLEYEPGKWASQAEITALVAEVKPYGGLYSTHLRSEGDKLVEALQEALAIAKGAGVPLDISHFKVVGYRNWGKEEQVVGLIEQAIGQGQKVFADVYPYLSPDYGINKKLSDWAGFLPPEYMVISIANDPKLVGKTVAEAANVLNLTVDQTVATLSAPEAGVAIVALVSSEKAMLRFYRAPWSVVSTDGEAQPKLATAGEALAHSFHRRSYGSYPMLLGQYVREGKLMGLEAMIHKMTGAVADNIGLKERGYLKPGAFADIVVFDPATIADRTSWVRPQEYPAGITHVLVNGVLAVQDGKRLEGRPGKVLRHGE